MRLQLRAGFGFNEAAVGNQHRGFSKPVRGLDRRGGEPIKTSRRTHNHLLPHEAVGGAGDDRHDFTLQRTLQRTLHGPNSPSVSPKRQNGAAAAGTPTGQAV